MKQTLFLKSNTSFLTVEYEEMITSKNGDLLKFKKSYSDEDTYNKNFNNPLVQCEKTYKLVVVETEGDKVSLKFFNGGRVKRIRKKWAKVEKNLFFITVNKKTGDVYSGSLINFHKKRKCIKVLKRNTFWNNNIDNLRVSIVSVFNHVDGTGYETSHNAFKIFLSEIIDDFDINNTKVSDILFEYYIKKRGIKYPNNFTSFIDGFSYTKFKKHLKNNDNKLVDAFMDFNGLKGRKIKKALHSCEKINVHTLKTAFYLFSESWINQDDNLIVNLLESDYFSSDQINPIIDLATDEEKKKMFELFKIVFNKKTINYHSYRDHILMYCDLKNYGEDIKWLSKTEKEFHNEHILFTEKLSYYRNGKYYRIYSENLMNFSKNPFQIDGVIYYPILLTNSSEYNNESNIQSNCVKTYIGRSSSVIFSLRKNNPESEERATIQYYVVRNTENKIISTRIQCLGKFNSSLDESWQKPMAHLDTLIDKVFSNNKFETFKIKKVCANGQELFSDTYWDDEGIMRWTYKKIEYESSDWTTLHF